MSPPPIPMYGKRCGPLGGHRNAIYPFWYGLPVRLPWPSSHLLSLLAAIIAAFQAAYTAPHSLRALLEKIRHG